MSNSRPRGLHQGKKSHSYTTVNSKLPQHMSALWHHRMTPAPSDAYWRDLFGYCSLFPYPLPGFFVCFPLFIHSLQNRYTSSTFSVTNAISISPLHLNIAQVLCEALFQRALRHLDPEIIFVTYQAIYISFMFVHCSKFTGLKHSVFAVVLNISL